MIIKMKKALFLGSILFFFSFCNAQQREQKKYNILIIESDDQSNQAVGAFGNPSIQTPSIDLLAEDGTSFTSAYNMGCWAPAVCVPSRTMLLYGKYLWKSQKITKKNAPESFPETLKNNGYSTYMTGKWHAYGNEAKDVFEQTGTITEGQLKTYNTDKGHITDITAKEAVDYIKSYKDDKPFLVYVAFNAPHVPRQTEKKYYDLYPSENIILPPSVIDGDSLNTNIKYQYTRNPLRAKTMKNRVQQNNAMVTHMDERIGNIISTLKEKGIYDDTIIVFMSDHGISFGENGVAGKVCVYEPSVTAPLIIKAPKMIANKKIKNRVYLQDVFPTLLDMLAIQSPENIDFKSLSPIVEENKDTRTSIYLAMFYDQRAIIKDNKKLILFPETSDLELYDLEKDPWETTNLKNQKNAIPIIKNLMKDFKNWQLKTKDTLDISKEFKKYL